MIKWDYKMIDGWSMPDFKELGLEGWEMIFKDGSYFYFKRPISEACTHEFEPCKGICTTELHNLHCKKCHEHFYDDGVEEKDILEKVKKDWDKQAEELTK